MMETDCLFCKIVAGEIPSEKVFENEKVISFKDIAPVAATHLLFIHKEHTKDVYEMLDSNPDQISDIFHAIHQYAKENGFQEKGFRLVNNCGSTAGQTVFHTHFHFISDSTLGGFGK